MSIIINGAAYMVLVYEGFEAALTVVQMAYTVSAIGNDMEKIMKLIGEMFKVLCFATLAAGIISRNKYLIRLWLLTAYMQIKWDAVGQFFYSIYEYFNTQKYKSQEEFKKHLLGEYGSLIGQVLTRIGIILIIYRFYLFLETPKKKGVKPQEK